MRWLLLLVGAVTGAVLLLGAPTAVRPAASAGSATVNRGLIVFTQGTESGPDFLQAIWIVRPDGSMLKRLSFPCVDCYDSAVLSPDGTRIAYFEYPSVFVMNRDGSGARPVCVDRCGDPVAWSPDGHRLVVGRATGRGLAIFDLESRRLQTLRTPAGAAISQVDWSPDGRWFTLVEAFRERIWVMRRDGTDARVVVRGPSYRESRWSPDSRTLLVGGREGIYVIPRSGGKLRLIHHTGTDTMPSPAWSPDGRKIAYADAHGFYVLDGARARVRRLDAATRTCSRPGRPAPNGYRVGRTFCYGLDWRR